MLAARAQTMTAPMESSASAPEGRALLVGLADDEAKAVEPLLATEGLGVERVADADRAIAALGTMPAALVLSDLALGQRNDGLRLARWILRHRPGTAMILLADKFAWIAADNPAAAVPILARPLNAAVVLQRLRELQQEARLVPATPAGPVA